MVLLKVLGLPQDSRPNEEALNQRMGASKHIRSHQHNGTLNGEYHSKDLQRALAISAIGAAHDGSCNHESFAKAPTGTEYSWLS